MPQIKWYNRILLSPNGAGDGGGDENLERKFAELQTKYDDLSKQFKELNENNANLTAELANREKEIEKSNRLLERANAELGGYKSTEARKAKISELLESADFKGKINLDAEKAMKYLNKGTFNPDTLDVEVKEAIELFGTPIARGTELSGRGAGTDAGQNNEPSNIIADPLGAALVGSK